MPMKLLDSPLNPMPPDGSVSFVTAADGVTLRSATWPASRRTGAPRGTVLLLQGRAEFIEKYFEIIGALRDRGFVVRTFDWRGQGFSDRALAARHLGHVRSFADFRLDYEAVRAMIPPGEPVTVLAHSMGGAIALWGAAEGWLAADRLACTNPMLGLSLVRAGAFAKRLARILAWAGLRERMVPGGVSASISTLPFPGNLLSTDTTRYDRNAALARLLEWRAIGSPTIGWLASAYAAMDDLARPGVAARIRLPVLMVLSERDPVCASATMTRFARSLPNARTIAIPEARHEILMESDAILQRFWEAFDAFLADIDPGRARTT